MPCIAFAKLAPLGGRNDETRKLRRSWPSTLVGYSRLMREERGEHGKGGAGASRRGEKSRGMSRLAVDGGA